MLADNGGAVATVALNGSASNQPRSFGRVEHSGYRRARLLAVDIPGGGADGAVSGIRDLGAFEYGASRPWW